jgi:hypothetical protein
MAPLATLRRAEILAPAVTHAHLIRKLDLKRSSAGIASMDAIGTEQKTLLARRRADVDVLPVLLTNLIAKSRFEALFAYMTSRLHHHSPEVIEVLPEVV